MAEADSTAGHRRKIGWPAIAVIALVEVIAVLGIAAYCQYSEPVSELSAAASFEEEVTMPTADEPLALPTEGQAALALEGMGTVITHNVETGPVPIASTTKIMTALLVLERHPLEPGEEGPTIPITQADQEAWWESVMEDQSNVEVQAGTDLTLREALQAVLVASGNNVAEILARWDSETIGNFVDGMNARAEELGMEDTTYTDVSGLDAGNVSTAEDLLILAREAMQHPVFAEIVAMESVSLPVVGERENTNILLGQDGFIGIKTGETEEAGACLVWAVELEDNRRIYGVVLGQPVREQVFTASEELAAGVPGALSSVDVIDAGDTVGNVTSEWGGATTIVAAEDLRLDGWAGDDVSIDLELGEVSAPVAAGETVGQLHAEVRNERVAVDLVTTEAIDEPGLWWRLRRD